VCCVLTGSECLWRLTGLTIPSRRGLQAAGVQGGCQPDPVEQRIRQRIR
jgi:hypothetical protein